MKNLILCILLAFVFYNVSATIQQDTLQIGIYESPPFVIYKDVDKLEGVSVWLWEHMKINKPYKLIRYTSNEPLKNILKDIEDNKIDFSINPLTITNQRSKKIDFTYPFYIGNLTIVKKAGTKISPLMGLLHSIFNYRLLYLVLILVLMVGFFGTFIWLIEKRNKHFERGFQGLLTSFWWSAVTMTTVGYGDKVPISNTGRFIAFVWMLCSLIIISIFTASITSNLTVHKLALSEMSIDDFKQTKVGTVGSSATEAFLKRNFFKNVKTYPEFIKGLEALKQDSVEVFIYDEPWLDHQLQNTPEFSDLELIPLRFDVQLYAMPMRKNLPPDLRNSITSSLLELIETHDWQLLLKEYQLDQY